MPPAANPVSPPPREHALSSAPCHARAASVAASLAHAHAHAHSLSHPLHSSPAACAAPLYASLSNRPPDSSDPPAPPAPTPAAVGPRRRSKKTSGRLRTWMAAASRRTSTSTPVPAPVPAAATATSPSASASAALHTPPDRASSVCDGPPVLPALALDQSFLDPTPASAAALLPHAPLSELPPASAQAHATEQLPSAAAENALPCVPADAPPSEPPSTPHAARAPSLPSVDPHPSGDALAARIWNGDSSFLPRNKVAAWLGSDLPDANAARTAYFSRLDFHSLRLDTAFRRLCDRLYLKAETQQIDRLLSAFAQRYWDCLPPAHRTHLFRSPTAVHSLAYSLVLLNTDLHVADLSGRHMTRSEYVSNTMHALASDGLAPAALWLTQHGAEFDDDLDGRPESSLCMSWEPPSSEPSHAPPRAPSTGAAHIYAPGRAARALNRISMSFGAGSTGVHGLSTLSVDDDTEPEERDRAWGADMQALLKDMYISVKAHQIRLPAPSGSSDTHAPSRGSILFRSWGASTTSFLPAEPPSSPHQSASRRSTSRSPAPSESPRPSGASLRSSSAVERDEEVSSGRAVAEEPSMSGLLVRQQVAGEMGKRVRDRDLRSWGEKFALVEDGCLRLFRLGASSHGKERAPAPTGPVGAGDWRTHAVLTVEIPLAHARASLSKPARTRWDLFNPWAGPVGDLPVPQGKAGWTLHLPNGAVWVFGAGTPALAREWVDTTLYWAARSTRPPLPPAVGSEEYGWGHLSPRASLSAWSSEWTPSDGEEEEEERIETPSTTPTSSVARRGSVHSFSSLRSTKSTSSLIERFNGSREHLASSMRSALGKEPARQVAIWIPPPHPVGGAILEEAQQPSRLLARLQQVRTELALHETCLEGLYSRWRVGEEELPKLPSISSGSSPSLVQSRMWDVVLPPLFLALERETKLRSDAARARANFHRRRVYLLSEILKYTTYLAALGHPLDGRPDSRLESRLAP